MSQILLSLTGGPLLFSTSENKILFMIWWEICIENADIKVVPGIDEDNGDTTDIPGNYG